MIPMPVFSSAFVILYLLGWFALAVLVIWGATLALSPTARAAFSWNWPIGLLAGVLVIASGYSTLLTLDARRVLRRVQREQAALHVTTTAALRIAGVTLPIGTQLTTRQPGVMESFTDATFPSPTIIYGVRALELHRSIPYPLDDSLAAATGATIMLATDDSVEGWRCSATTPVEFSLAEGTAARLQKCTLAPGNQAGTLTIPAGATLLASEGALWSDGTHERDRWVVMMEDSTPPIRLFGAELVTARLNLSERRELLRVSEAALASDFRLGTIQYSKGTRVSSAPPTLLVRHPGALMFSPQERQVVSYPGHRDVTAGFTLVQSPDGRVHGVFPNAEVGVLDFQRIEVGTP